MKFDFTVNSKNIILEAYKLDYKTKKATNFLCS